VRVRPVFASCGALLASVVLITAAAPVAQATPGPIIPAVTPSSVTAAVTAAQHNGDRVAVAVLDTVTNSFYGAGDVDGEFVSESIVKVLIAANLLATGQLDAQTQQLALSMIAQSDDNAADALWGVVGGPAVISWAETRYGISDLGDAPAEWGWWGNTKFTARGLVELYASLKADPVVGPWLIAAMSQMTPFAADGTDQRFGLATQTSAAALKQGWGDDDDNSNSQDLDSTGYLSGDRYAVVIFVQHVPGETMYDLLPTINAVAAAVAPGGIVATPRPVAPPVSTATRRPVQSGNTSASASGSAAGSSASGSAADSSASVGSASPTTTAPSSSTTLNANAAPSDDPEAASDEHVTASRVRTHPLEVRFVAAVAASGLVLSVLALRPWRKRVRAAHGSDRSR
jgi:Beta-lactamase enzyme family